MLRNLTYCNGFRFQTTYIPKIIWASIFKSYLPPFYISSKVTRNKTWVCRHYISQYLCDEYFIFLCTAARWKMKAIFIQNMEPLHQMRIKWLNIKKPSPSDVKNTHKDKISFLFFPLGLFGMFSVLCLKMWMKSPHSERDQKRMLWAPISMAAYIKSSSNKQ